MNTRLKEILITLARQYAPQLLAIFGEAGQSETEHIARIARGLAAYHFLVLVGEPPTNAQVDQTRLVQEWVNTYRAFYNVMANTLFPSYTITQVYSTDLQMPLAVVLRGQSVPLMHILSGYIVPYVATRQQRPGASEAELWGLMDIVLNELAADDLPRRDYNRLRAEGATLLKRLLNSPIRQIALNGFDQPVLAGMEIPPNVMAIPDTSVQTPASIPLERLEDDEQRAETGQHPPMSLEGQQLSKTGHLTPSQRAPHPMDLPELSPNLNSLGVGGGGDEQKKRPSSLPEEDSGLFNTISTGEHSTTTVEDTVTQTAQPPSPPPTPQNNGMPDADTPRKSGTGPLRLPETGTLRPPGTGPLRRPPVPDLPPDEK